MATDIPLLSFRFADDMQRTALKTTKRSYSWAELDAEVERVCQAMYEQGVRGSDVVALVSRTCVSQLLNYLACLRLGALPALVAPAPPAQLRLKFETLACSHVWLGKGADSTDFLQDCTSARFLSADFDSGEPKESAHSRHFHPRRFASIVFTSGSTGTPKAVVHTVEQHLASAEGLLKQFRFSDKDSWLLSLPMYHVSGLAIVWRWLLTQACLKVGDGNELSSDLQGVTHASLVPTQLRRLLDSGEPLSLKRVLLGGSYIPLPLAQEANSRGIDTWLGYGMTEAASTVTAKPVDDKPGTGQLLDNRTLKIEGNRIYIAGKTLASGYYYRGKLEPVMRNGWFDTKDLGAWKEGGLVIQGRADNQFISGGENIHCEEIEAVLVQHPEVTAAVVVPIKDSEFGARPLALLSCDTDVDKESMHQFLLHRLEKFKWPSVYLALPEALKRSNGIKLSRSDVRNWIAAYTSYTPLN